MEQLATQYTKNTFAYNLVNRTEDVAIYAQTMPECDNKVIGYEVFEVQKYPAREMGGKLIAASEASPGNEQWGKSGFTCRNIDDARSKQTMLLERIHTRASQN